MNPYYLKEKPNDGLPVPCGKCPGCLKRRVSAWSFRLMQEERRAISSYFITLTYDNAHINKESGTLTNNGFMSLNKRHLQLFFKRVRKRQQALASDGSKIKYYVVGEYGERTRRPHYHVLGFNMSLLDLIGEKACRVIDIMGFDSKRQVECALWGLGRISVGTVDERSVGYALKYMTKKPGVGLHERDDRVKEFALMSKGLGECYLTDEMKAWHLACPYDRMYCNIEDGKKIAMPRYYKNKIYGDELRPLIGAVVRQKMVDKEFDALVKLTREEREMVNKNYRESVTHAFDLMYRDSLKDRIVNF